MSYNWLFVVQTCEVKPLADSAANVEIIQPLLCSQYVANYHVLAFEQNYASVYQAQLHDRFEELILCLEQQAVVVYGAGLHTRQHWEWFSRLNPVAIADKSQQLWGETIHGIPIISPDEIHQYASQVVISSKAFELEIINQLASQHPELECHGLYRDQRKENKGFTAMAEQISEYLKSHYVDIVFFSPTHPNECLPPQYWRQIKSQFPEVRFATIFWDYDEDESGSPYLQFERDSLSWADLCIENSNGARLARMKLGLSPYQSHVGTDKVHFLPTLFDPAIFYRDDVTPKSIELAIFGSDAGERARWISELTQRYSERFKHIGGIRYDGRMLSISEYATALRQTRICINTQTYSFREQCKGKVREALACGVLLLEQDNLPTRQFVEEGEGVLYFSDRDELFALIDELEANPLMVEQIIKKGQQVAAKRLTPDYWAGQVLQWLGLDSAIKE